MVCGHPERVERQQQNQNEERPPMQPQVHPIMPKRSTHLIPTVPYAHGHHQ